MNDNQLKIAGYLRISVDMEIDKDKNTSIENQRESIMQYVESEFPNAGLDFYIDRDRSGYTFEQREGYMKLRPLLQNGTYDALIVKDLSRFSRRNSRGLMELEDLRDYGVRIIAINDGIDYPVQDDWMLIQFKFLMNEMPVTETSKKVRRVIKVRQKSGEWICSVPYGYVMTNSKNSAYTVDEKSAAVVRQIFELYNSGWGYKKIAEHLTAQYIPTPRMLVKEQKEQNGEICKLSVSPVWSTSTVKGILENDFYIGTLRQRKYTRTKINGTDRKLEESEQLVFENKHEPIVSFQVFAEAHENMKKRTRSNYRGKKKYDNDYTGILFCGDCGSPMFSMSRDDLAPAYRCGAYHKRGLKGCSSSHHIRTDFLDILIKRYILNVRNNSKSMLAELDRAVKDEEKSITEERQTVESLNKQLIRAKSELKATYAQKTREMMKNPENEELIESTFDEILHDLSEKIKGLESQIELVSSQRRRVRQTNRLVKTALEVFDEILKKDKLSKKDLGFIVDKITVYEDRVEIDLKNDIKTLLGEGKLSERDSVYDLGGTVVNFEHGTDDISDQAVLKTKNQRDKVIGVNVMHDGDPLEIYTDANGEVIFKKYSPIGELSPYTKQYVEVLNRSTGLPSIICDRDHVIAAAGMPKKEVMDKRISPMVEGFMEKRANYTADSEKAEMTVCEGVDRRVSVMCPIIGAGDVMGAVMVLANGSDAPPSQTEIKLVQVAAGFLGRQMEE